MKKTKKTTTELKPVKYKLAYPERLCINCVHFEECAKDGADPNDYCGMWLGIPERIEINEDKNENNV
jgi:hypothetical protein